MPDLDVVAIITAKPGAEGAVRDALAALVPPTREEAGCVSYSLYESSSTPGTFVTVESWNGQSDLDEHLASAHIAKAFEVAGDALAAPPAIHTLTPIDVQ